jgi:hypothetical protein
MNPIRSIRRLASILAGLAATTVALAAAAPAALASPAPPDPGPARLWPIVVGGMPVPAYPSAPARAPAQVHTIVSGGMPGWQIILIAIGAALAAAAVAVLLDRAQMTRKTRATTA